MVSSSDALTEECSAGESRNHRYHTSDQTNPIEPKRTNNVRQLKNLSNTVTSKGVSPPARCAPMKNTPCAVPRSRRGNHREKVRATFGHAPASPAPNRNRIARSDE